MSEETALQAINLQDRIAQVLVCQGPRAVLSAQAAPTDYPPPELEALRNALKRLKLRITFMGWPAEDFWNVGTAENPNWQPDWRYECQLIDHMLHGTPITTPEKPDDTKPHNQLATSQGVAVPQPDAFQAVAPEAKPEVLASRKSTDLLFD